MRKLLLVALTFSVFMALGGCEMTNDDKSAPALMKAHSESSLQVLRQALKELSFGHDVRVTDSAFRNGSSLLVERRAPIHNNRELPLDENKALVFTLWIKGEDCMIKREDTQDETTIDRNFCVRG